MALIEEITDDYPTSDARRDAPDMKGSDCRSPQPLHPELACLFSVFHPRYALSLFQHLSSRLLNAPLPDTTLALLVMNRDQFVQPIFNTSVNFDQPFAPLPQYLKDLLRKQRGLLAAPPDDHSNRFELLPCDPEPDPVWQTPGPERPWSRDSYGCYEASEPYGHPPGNETIYSLHQPTLSAITTSHDTAYVAQSSYIDFPIPVTASDYYESTSQEQDPQYTVPYGPNFAATHYEDEPSFGTRAAWSKEVDKEPAGSISSYCTPDMSFSASEISAYDDAAAGQVIGSDPGEEQQYSSQSQWRVGRLPGHQGSHVKSPKRHAADMSASPPHRSPERVLKKPFRPPTKVVLPRVARAPDEDQTYADRRSPTALSGTGPLEVRRQWPGKPKTPARIVLPRKADKERDDRCDSQEAPLVDYPHAQPGALPRAASDRVSKPFKQPGEAVRPVVRSMHRPTPYPLASDNTGNNRSNAREVMKLEDRLRTLKTALRYLDEPEEDEKLASLIDTWRDAGRQVAEMLYQRYPKPEPDDPWSNTSRPLSAGVQWGADTTTNSWSADTLSDEQRRYMANLTVNKNGDTVDREGNLMYPDEGPDDIPSLLDTGSRTRSTRGQRDFNMRSIGGYDRMAEPLYATSAIPSSKWTVGSVMLKLGVDPDLLGWEASEEDWRE